MKEGKNYIGEKVGDVYNMDVSDIIIKAMGDIIEDRRGTLKMLIASNPNDADLGKVIREIYE